MKTLGARLAVALLWPLRFLPRSWQWRLGQALGELLFRLAGSRRKVVLRNLERCFPDLSAVERLDLAKKHFRALACAFVDLSNLWWADEAYLRARHALLGREKIDALLAQGQTVIVLGYHCVGIEAAGLRLTMDYRLTAYYMPQSNPVMDARMRRARNRFLAPVLLRKDAGARKLVQAMKDGAPAYYLPDMDFGPRDSIFVPFFGVPAATVTGLSRIARLAGAKVVPLVTRQLEDGKGYESRFEDPWENYPSGDLAADARTMNAWLEGVVRTQPEQYYWVHKRFKTRPPGEQGFYG